MAITGFILSLLWLGGLGSLVGLCLGAVATRRTRQRNQAGRGLAIAALILGIVGLLGTASLVGAAIFLGRIGSTSSAPAISGLPATPQAATPSGGATAASVGPAKVAALMQKISANPKDVASLQGLGDIYFASGDYKNAAVWEQKVLEVDPKNQVALLALGAAQFNLGNAAEAKKTWLVAAGLYPESAEVHYDLGFLYFSQTPQDKVNMQAEWARVVAIDPNSKLAKSVATTLKRMAEPSGTPIAK